MIIRTTQIRVLHLLLSEESKINSSICDFNGVMKAELVIGMGEEDKIDWCWMFKR